MIKGRIEVVCGSMFSGKTEELLRRINRARIANQKVQVFKPKTDTRYHETKVVSHSSKAVDSIPVSNATDIPSLVDSDTIVVAIDEAQFFDKSLPLICHMMANAGKRVIIAGLDMDFQGKPFGPMPELLSIAEQVTKVHAVCMDCGEDATFSFRKTENKDKVMLGETESYKPLCRICYNNQ